MAVCWRAHTLLHTIFPQMRRRDVEAGDIWAVCSAAAATVVLCIVDAAEAAAAMAAAAVSIPAFARVPHRGPRLRAWNWLFCWYGTLGWLGVRWCHVSSLAVPLLQTPLEAGVAAAGRAAQVAVFRVARPSSSICPEMRRGNVKFRHQWICRIAAAARIQLDIIGASKHAAAMLPVATRVSIPLSASVGGVWPGLRTWNWMWPWNFRSSTASRCLQLKRRLQGGSDGRTCCWPFPQRT
mmetsp:Transcript_69969/g.167098  ORF Transcript_69969/g.167098 Transcript_69969/m.167098 type:complete len:238 (+) Transcript_69969:457-1170(+)